MYSGKIIEVFISSPSDVNTEKKSIYSIIAAALYFADASFYAFEAEQLRSSFFCSIVLC